MAKRKTTWTEQKIENYIKEGRGSGELDNYKPWLTNQDFASKGRTHRPKYTCQILDRQYSQLSVILGYQKQYCNEYIRLEEQIKELNKKNKKM